MTFQLGSRGNPFDAGIVIHDGPAGGYNWPLSQHREYYTRNVQGTNALTHEQYCVEFPKAAAALAESDARFVKFNQMLGDPQKAAQFMEIYEHLLAGKPVALSEAFPMQPPAATMPQAQPAQAPVAPDPEDAADMHTHQVQCDEQGNGSTDAGADGHVHGIRGNKVLAQNGHTHQFDQMKNQPPMPAQAAPVAPPQGGN